MLTPSASIRNAMTAPLKLVGARVAIYTLNSEIPVEYTSSDVLASVALTQEGGYFLSAVRSGTIKLVGDSFPVYAGLKCGVWLRVKTGVDNQNNEVWEEIPYGNFFIKEEKIDLKNGMTELSVIDQIGLMRETNYRRGEIQYPATVASIIEQVAVKFGLTLASSVAGLPNASVLIPAATEDTLELFEEGAETTYRDILDMLAGATATVARVKLGVADTLELAPVQLSSQENLAYSNLMSVSFGDKFGASNTFTLATEPQEDNIIAPATYDSERVEIRLTNNEIATYADDDADTKRIAMANALLSATAGLEYSAGECKTEGHGWYEVGDRIKVFDGENNEMGEMVLSTVSVTIAGSLKETLKSTIPDTKNTDYSTAGSSTKTVWNVRLMTDKQQGQIDALVQKTIQTDETVQANYTEYLQTVNSITQSVQKAGGSNCLKNSVGYDFDSDGNFPYWTKTGTVSAQTSPESLNYGAVSGNQIDLTSGSSMVQTVTVSPNVAYSFSARVKKPTVGAGAIVLADGTNTWTIPLADGTEVVWGEVAQENIVPASNTLTVSLVNTNAEHLYITDAMLVQSDTKAPWQQSQTEILNTQVALTENGVRVKSSTSGDYVQITPLEFAGYSTVSGTEQKVFYLNKDTTKVAKLSVKSQITMPPLKIVPLTSGSKQGWAFVKTQETWEGN